MRILSVHIENFGNFNKKQFVFQEGLNAIIAENGWGKSTLAAFIKVMLYGFDERGRKLSGTFERERYLPWSGGKFGGSLVFSLAGETYKITRFFDAEKKKFDSCVVTDMRINRSTDIFGNDIGLYLFGIGKESFERSCFINSDVSKKPELSDDISAKLNNILEDDGDIGNCRSAVSSIDALIGKLNNRGKSAQTALLRDDIRNAKIQIASIAEIEKDAAQKEHRLEEEKTALAEAVSRLHILEKEKDNILLYEQKKIYGSLIAQRERAKEGFTALHDFFNGSVPDAAVLENIGDVYFEYMRSRTELANNNVGDADRIRFAELQRFFECRLPSFDDIEYCQKLINEKNRIREEIGGKRLTENEKAKLEAYKRQFAHISVSDSDIRCCFDCISKVQRMENEKAVLLEKQKMLQAAFAADGKIADRRKFRFRVLGAAGLLLFGALGVAIRFFSGNIFVSLPVFIFAALSALPIFLPKLARRAEAAPDLSRVRESIAALSDSVRKGQKVYTDFIKSVHPSFSAENPVVELSAIQSEYNAYAELLQKEAAYRTSLRENVRLNEIERLIKSFTAPYEAVCNTSDADAILSVLRKNRAEYVPAARTIRRCDAAISSLKKSETELVKRLGRYKIDAAVSFEKQIDDVKEKLLLFNNTKTVLADIAEKIAAFEATHDIDLIAKAFPANRSTEEIRQAVDSAQGKLQTIKSNIAFLQEKLDADYDAIDRKANCECTLEMKEIELAKTYERVRILEATKNLLNRARDSLSGKYMKKMEESFSSYLAELHCAETVSLDKDLNVIVEGEGSSYSGDHLSAGYKDIVNFCTRLALADVMFEAEQPILVLDDPFINLDGGKIIDALRIVAEAAKDKQIIYFTCHESRREFLNNRTSFQKSTADEIAP